MLTAGLIESLKGFRRIQIRWAGSKSITVQDLVARCSSSLSLSHRTTKPDTASLRPSFRTENREQNRSLGHRYTNLTPPLPPALFPLRFLTTTTTATKPFAPSAAPPSRRPTRPTSRHLEWLALPVSRGNPDPPWQTQSDRKQGAAGEGWKQRRPQSERKKETPSGVTERRERRQVHTNGLETASSGSHVLLAVSRWLRAPPEGNSFKKIWQKPEAARLRS